MSEQQAFILDSKTDDGKPCQIHGIAQWPTGGAEPRPTVIICHGFKGFMEWGFFPPLADLLVERGFTVIRFNYSGSGMRPGDELVTDPAAFRANTFSQERQETLQVLAAAGESIAPGQVDRDRLGLVGHSRGGGASLLASASAEWSRRLRALVTWAGVGTFDRFGDDAKKLWLEHGAVPLRNARTGQELELGIELMHDIEQNHATLDLAAAAAERRAPWLIVHGSGDETVPVAEAQNLDRAARDPHELLVIEGAG
ncbi:MAG: alpha/beta hydrolase, partial [Acidobacteriota bacterium]